MRIPRNGMDPSPSLRPCSAEDQNEGVEPTHLIEEDRSTNEITILAIDFAKSVFQLHGIDGRNVTVLRRPHQDFIDGIGSFSARWLGRDLSAS